MEFADLFKPLSEMPEEEPQWFIEGFLPKGQICTLASDGGTGKTTLAINITACRSAGKASFLDPPGFACDPQRIAFLSSEDSVKAKLRKRIREAGANLENVIVPDIGADTNGILRELKFGTAFFDKFVRQFAPDLVIVDPLQGFLPPQVNMGSRNQMRDCMAPLVGLGEEIGTTFLIICHTNKRKGASGRDRIADSADLWDISRSVLMMGSAEDSLKYLSHEKSNYAELQETRLLTINKKGNLESAGRTWKRDRDFQQETVFNTSSTEVGEAADFILEELARFGNHAETKSIDKSATDYGFSKSTIRRAKDRLKEAGTIGYHCIGFGKEKSWFIDLLPTTETA